METLSDEFASQRQLAITEKFEGFMNYMYPIALNIRKTHHVARDRLIAGMFEHSREALAVLQHGLKWFSDVQLGLVFSKWSIGPVTQGLDWLGYRIWPTHKLLRRRSVIAAKRKIKKYRASGDKLSLSRFIASWKGHAQWADSFNLLNKLGVPA